MTETDYGEVYLENEGKILSVLREEKIYDEDLLHDTYIALYERRDEIREARFVTYFVAWYKQLYFRQAVRNSRYVYCGTNVEEKYDVADESDLAQREKVARRVDDIIERYNSHPPKGSRNHERACKILQLYREGLSVRQIACELKMGKSTVQQYLDYSIRKIRREYGQRGV